MKVMQNVNGINNTSGVGWAKRMRERPDPHIKYTLGLGFPESGVVFGGPMTFWGLCCGARGIWKLPFGVKSNP